MVVRTVSLSGTADPKTQRSKNYGNVFDTGFRCKDEEVFGGWIAHGEATDGRCTAMDHDIAAEIGSAIATSMVFVEVVGVIDAESEMEMAVGIEGFDFVQAFRDLTISLS